MIQAPALGMVVSALVAGPLAAQAVWDPGAPFTASPQELLRFSGQHPVLEREPVCLLFEGRSCSVDAQGRRYRVFHTIYRVDADSHLRGWSEISATWSSWYQEKPVLQARVISPDGSVHTLDPATLGEYSKGRGAEGAEAARRTLAGPLPHMALGAIVEEVTILRDHTPFFGSGGSGRIPLAPTPTAKAVRFSLDAPEGVPLRWQAKGTGPVQPVEAVKDGRRWVRLAMGPLAPPSDSEPNADPARWDRPRVEWTTQPGWGDLAEAYGKLIPAGLPDDLKAWLAGLPGQVPDVRVRAATVVTRMHQRVRTEFVSWGDVPLAPRAPEETLRRGVGDVKDKAALLVRMLEAAGIPARMALVRTEDQDQNPEVPDLMGFDFALVRVEGRDGFWIDPANDIVPLGVLYPDAQGRGALLAGPGARGLVKTDLLDGKVNRALEVREVFLAEQGPARVVETSEYGGLEDLKVRRNLGGPDPAKSRTQLADYVRNAYDAKAGEVVAMPDLRDLAVPARFVLEARGVGTARTGWIDAYAQLHVWGMFREFQKLLEGDGKKPLPPRTQDLVQPEPVRVEWRYRVHPPKGYVLRSLPESDRLPLGPATFTRSYAREGDGTALASFVLDSGPARWTPAQVEAARKALTAFSESRRTDLIFDQEGEALLKAGRAPEALAAFRKLAADEPASPLPWARKAQALLGLGLGEAAREAARKGVALAPGSALAQDTLGWVLQFDEGGRRFHKGWDRKGSSEAYERALAADPDLDDTRADYALLLERNADGERYGPGAELDKAIALYKTLHDKKLHGRDESYLAALGQAGRFKEACELAASMEASPFRTGWWAASLVRLKGADAALAELRGLLTNAFTWEGGLHAAVLHLMDLRDYAAAVAVLKACPAGGEGAEARGLLLEAATRAVPAESRTLDAADPRAVFVRLASLHAGGLKGPEDVAGLVTPGLRAHLQVAENWDVLKGSLRQFSSAALDLDLDPRPALDASLALSEFKVEGSAAQGWRVTVRAPGQKGALTQVWAFSAGEGGCRLAAFQADPGTFGQEALTRLEAGDLAGARGFLDWARELLPVQGGDDPLGGHPFPHLWIKGRAAEAEATRTAAAVLACREKEDARILPLLEQGGAAVRDPFKRARLDQALIMAYLTREAWAKAEAPVARIAAVHEDSRNLRFAQVLVLRNLGRWEDLYALEGRVLARFPEDEDMLGSREATLAQLGRSDERLRLVQTKMDHGTAQPGDLNNLAWYSLLLGRVSDTTLEVARRAARASDPPHPGTLHTLAAVLAEVGPVPEAAKALQASLAGRPSESLGSNEYYVLGRMAERLGEPEVARACYQRVKPDDPPAPPADSCWFLAQRRLKALGAAL
ncbi:DUF3857 domain-containing protein [Mesoterricola sediminis]|uniref:DUF3857 domain-containing protein n=1 Tax=Mesoterricola sediminis TaxID=2927980 RepID=A0AA48GY05_9BACT|nr:DUF3857 domain-containing protein [Mesoterricola sediminis]BDU77695.1 hypothetical protein METESE_26530 [Mesoterricola sediminis]